MATTLPKRRRASNKSAMDKASLVFEYMRSLRISMSEFVECIPKMEGPGVHHRQQLFAQAVYASKNLTDFYIRDNNFPFDRDYLIDSLQFPDSLREELNQLAATNIFNKNVKDKQVSFENLDLNQISTIIQETVPKTSKLLHSLLSSSRMGKNKDTQVEYRIFLIISIFCYTQHPGLCTNIPTTLGLYFYSKNAQRSILELLNKFGVIINYRKLMETVEIKKRARGKVFSQESSSPSSNVIPTGSASDDDEDIYEYPHKSSYKQTAIEMKSPSVSKTSDSDDIQPVASTSGTK